MAIPSITDYPMPTPEAFPANRTQWQPDPARAVLLIHDMQRYFLRFYDADGALVRQLVDNLVAIRRWARERGVPVVYTAQPHEQPAADRALLNDMWGPGLTTADPALQAIVAPLAPEEGDTVLTKWRYSAFQRSELLSLLRQWGRDQLLVGGVYAHIGCMITSADAFMNDIQPFLVGDAVADFSPDDHLMALRYVATRCGSVVTTKSLLDTAAPTLSRDWLVQRVRALIEEEVDFDPDENLIYYGLDSVQVMLLASELKERGVAVRFEELTRIPTLNAWWSLIEGKQPQAIAA
ncbi:isochorismatase family protein [Labrys neptuniae]|uniref:isochorismatase family protein n=1 Tax=Labrys neptuniae TaxID=376174 RepID=UPI00288D3CC6|nr:isochorismatase family protein [Labrys neptuniae]MDT3380493.1 isochorismatase family protein [Labrys neptuniae]